MTTSDASWHLDKRVPITMIFAIMLQSSAAVWWASGINQRMAQIESRHEINLTRSEQADQNLAEQGRRIAVLSEALSNTNRNLERVNGEIANTNAILREMLLNGSAPPRSGGQ